MKERKDTAVDDIFASQAKQLFDESVAGLDGETQSRLNRGRQAALAQAMAKPKPWLQWAPAAGLTAAAVAAFVIWTGSSELDSIVVPAVATDMEILLAEDDLEMIEDLEFYSWIDLEAEIEGAWLLEQPFENNGRDSGELDSNGPTNNVG